MRSKLSALLLVLSLSGVSILQAAPFIVEPGTDVEVGEEVYFDATATIPVEDLDSAVLAWDFGDGFSLDAGGACTHFFMTPGAYTVKLTNNGAPVNDTVITVTGEAPIKRFEVRHAPFHARIGQYIKVRVPNTAYDDASNRLKVSLTSDQGYAATLLDKSALVSYETFLLKNRDLPAGNYTLLVELLDQGGSRFSYIKETFAKPYAGIPRVGINEDNAICIEGVPFFPVTPWLLGANSNRLGLFADSGYINTSYAMGYYTSYEVEQWQNYLTFGASYDLMTVGPGGKWMDINPNRNNRMSRLSEWVTHTREDSSLLVWMWDDEPNMVGPAHQYVAPEVLRAWTYKSHQLDPHHPVTTNLMGFGYLPYYGGGGNDAFSYLNNANRFGGRKTFPVDIMGMDYYPIAMQDHLPMGGEETGSEISDYISAVDMMGKKADYLIPSFSFIEVCKIWQSDENPAITKAQVLMEAWLNVVHGIKAINWFHYFVGETIQYEAMTEFCDQITRLTPVVLGPDAAREVTDDADTKGNRVDVMVKETDDHIYIFAVRLTEIDEQDATALTPVFTIAGVTDETAEVFDESRSIDVTDGKFTDSFAPNDYHIYKVTKNTAGVADRSGYKAPLKPEWMASPITGRELWKMGSGVRVFTMSGTALQPGRTVESGAYLVQPEKNRAIYKIIVVE